MMTQQLGFSVLSAPLAAIDRRSLSQAWYSALHLARDAAPPRALTEHARVLQVPGRNKEPGSVPHARPAHDDPSLEANPRRVESKRVGLAMEAPERRLRRSALSRKIECAFLHPAKRCERATFTLEGTNARVHVALQGSGANLRLVAICPPSLRHRVARALEEARYALALRGVACTLDVKEA